ncbi:MAG: VIT1/CCC1 transporter family protein [Promethearchaeota archaeon]
MGRWKQYNEITNLNSIARRYFINNFYDGMLTVLGILLGFFVIILRPEITSIQSFYIILPSLGTSISMFISGVSGSYLSERAEQRKMRADLEKAMGKIKMMEDKIDEKEIVEIQKAMITPLKNKTKFFLKKPKKKKIKTLHEKAESFTGRVVSLINGGAPFLGGVVALLPFFFVSEAGIVTFLISFLIIFICIIFLGIFLGVISKDSIPKNILQMLAAFTLTFLVIIIFLS